MTEPEFFSKEWASAVGDALTAGPSEQARAGKLQVYWDFFEQIKNGCDVSWALGCPDLPAGGTGSGVRAGAPAYLFVQWGGGAVTDCRIIDPDSPLEATYVLGMDYADWKALHEGYDAQRTVMYRKILLEDGELLEFFKSIYFFVECLAVIGAVPGRYPEALSASPVAELPGDGCRCLGMDQVARVLDRKVKRLFPADAVVRAELLRDDDHPGLLKVRVVVPETEDLDAWAAAHRERMEELRRELSVRLPSARVLEFTSDAPDAAVISMPDDGSLAAERLTSREIVVKALALLRENYVFPELAEQVATGVETRLAAGEYDDLDEITLAELLTGHLQEASGDKHLRVQFVGGIGPAPRVAGRPPVISDDRESSKPKGRLRGRLDNFGIHRVERLDGNIGYLDLRRVPMPENAGPAIAAAMELVSGTYALIIDLRHNGGGSPHGVAYWCSYLLPEEPVRLNDIFRADTGETRQFWSLPYLPGSRYTGRPVYVLTSSHTFSGGEDLCYTLQALGRAEVIGETTGGGAHPTKPFPISVAMRIGIPFARSINPVTGTNWQGTGVIPDTPASADDAYSVAYAKALRSVAELGDVPPSVVDEARDALATLSA